MGRDLYATPCPSSSIWAEQWTDEPFRWTVNGVGYSPHVAVMGQAGSGKTRTMLEMLAQVRKQSGAPVIVLDLGKGDLANRHDFIKAIGARVVRVPDEPIPLDMFFGSDESDLTASDAIMGFRDSFAKVMQSKAGAVQLGGDEGCAPPALLDAQARSALRTLAKRCETFIRIEG
jgi:hypothetical protein